MSNSRKKRPYIKIGKNGYLKKFARRKLRKTENVGNFANYKRHFDSWDICDGRWYVTKDDIGTIWGDPKWQRK